MFERVKGTGAASLDREAIQLLKPYFKYDKSYDRLFLYLEGYFPSFVAYRRIKDELRMITINWSDVERLREDGYLESLKERGFNPPAGSKAEDFFRLTPQGFQFLNNIHVRRLNRRLFYLTVVLIVLGLIQFLATLYKAKG